MKERRGATEDREGGWAPWGLNGHELSNPGERRKDSGSPAAESP